jgi:muramoyltetrapeptide carboxypeptidase
VYHVDPTTVPAERHIPPPVSPGGHIRIISPGMPILALVPERAQRAEKALADLGFVVSYGRHAFEISDDGLAAGTAEQRATDFMAAFADPSVDAVLASEAGCGSEDLLDLLDPAVLAANPKPFLGYCDNVLLNQFLASRAGISSLYGATMMVHFGEGEGGYPETTEFLVAALDSSRPLVCTPVPSRTGGVIPWYVPELERLRRPRDIPGGWTWLRGGTARGALFGGEITLVPELVDRFDLQLDSCVLFWDISFHGLEVRDLFRAVSERVDMSRLAGMIVGAHPVVPPSDWRTSVAALLDEFIPEADYPVVVNADLSHTCPPWIVPYGEEVILEAPDRILFPRRSAGAGLEPPFPTVQHTQKA